MLKKKRDEMEILQAMLRLLSKSLYELGVGNYAKVYKKYSLLVIVICGLVIMQDD